MNFYTAGESHGPELTGIIVGIPSGLHIDISEINRALRSRQGGYGRGNRQQIEHDKVIITGGVRHQITIGSPIALRIKNIDHKHWSYIMDPNTPADSFNTLRRVTRPRPGHADLAGAMKYNHRDMRNVLERSSARETAMRVAIGNICEQLLKQLGITLVGYVQSVGKINADSKMPLDVKQIQKLINNDMRVIDHDKVKPLHKMIYKTRWAGDTLGGVIRVVANNVPAGLGSYISWNTKLDAKMAFAVMGVNAMKGVEIGDGFKASHRFGSQVMDPIDWKKDKGFFRDSDHLGGFEGGMTNGMPIIVKAAMKPIPTLYKPLKSVDINTKVIKKANIERSDVTAIVPASIVVENVVAIELAKVITETFDGSNMKRLKKQFHDYREELKNF